MSAAALCAKASCPATENQPAALKSSTSEQKLRNPQCITGHLSKIFREPRLHLRKKGAHQRVIRFETLTWQQ